VFHIHIHLLGAHDYNLENTKIEIDWATIHPDYQKGFFAYSDFAILHLAAKVNYPTPIVGSVCLLRPEQNEQVIFGFFLTISGKIANRLCMGL
jgi:hypothetical protein